MRTPIRLLLVEDSEEDALLVLRQLGKGGYEPEHERVETAEAMLTALRGTWDIILSDYSMPQFSGMAALELLKETGIDVPFVMISGKMGEEAAVEAMRAGAADYIFKDNLSRLVPAIRRELQEAESRGKRIQAEKKLYRSEAQLSNALEMAHLGPWEYDVINDLFTFNDPFYKVFRTTVEEIGGYTMHAAEYARRFVHPDDINMVGEEIRRAVETRDPHFSQQIEHRILYADGTVGHITVRFFILKDASGRTVRTNGVNQDITDRKQAEEALRESEENYRALASTVDSMYLVDRDLRYRFVNENYQSRLGMTLKEIEGRGYGELHSEEDAELFAGAVDAVLETGKSLQTEHRSKRDNKYFLRTFSPVRNSDGRITTVTVASKDITARKRAEQSLRESEELYRAFINATSDLVYVKDERFRHLIANDPLAKYFGLKPADVIGKTDFELMPEAAARSRRISDLKAVQTKSITVTEEDLGGRIFETTNYPVALQDGRTGVGGMIREVTEKKQSFDRVRKALGATIHAMAALIETRDPYTAGHQRRVADLSRAMATEMGLTPHQIDGMRMAGIIHDVGKISVPAEILSMPRKLSEIEFSIIKTHVQSGYDILKGIEFPWPIARMVLEHHERMDGSGYPNGLTGDRLLMESRILTVADVVESMASHRPYRPSVGLNAALDEISKNMGVLYDPNVVNACLRLFNEKGYKLSDIH